MTLRILQQSVAVVRGGSVVRPPIGQPFNFTDDEISQIELASPDALSNARITEARAMVAAADAAEHPKGGKVGKVGKGGKPAHADSPDDDADL